MAALRALQADEQLGNPGDPHPQRHFRRAVQSLAHDAAVVLEGQEEEDPRQQVAPLVTVVPHTL